MESIGVNLPAEDLYKGDDAKARGLNINQILFYVLGDRNKDQVLIRCKFIG